MKRFALFTLAAVTLAACNTPQQPAEPAPDTLAVAEPEPVPSAFSTYDAEDDAYLTEAEFVSGFVASNHAAPYGAADGGLDEATFTSRYATSGLDDAAAFAAYDADADGRVSAQELASGLFRALDTNADGRLDQVEFQPLGATLDAAPTPEAPADPTPQADPSAPAPSAN